MSKLDGRVMLGLFKSNKRNPYDRERCDFNGGNGFMRGLRQR